MSLNAHMTLPHFYTLPQMEIHCCFVPVPKSLIWTCVREIPIYIAFLFPYEYSSQWDYRTILLGPVQGLASRYPSKLSLRTGCQTTGYSNTIRPGSTYFFLVRVILSTLVFFLKNQKSLKMFLYFQNFSLFAKVHSAK